jgi:hypothetical protein
MQSSFYTSSYVVDSPPAAQTASYAERHQERRFRDFHQHMRREASAAAVRRNRSSTPPARSAASGRHVSPSVPSWVGVASTAAKAAAGSSHRAGGGGGAARSEPMEFTEWSGRVTGASAAEKRASHARRPPTGRAIIEPSAVCWMCAKPCTAFGWCQLNSSFVHRIVFYPASLFTLCATCGKAVSLAPGTSLVDVVKNCNQTHAAREHSHAFVAFLREYMMLLEAAYLDLEDAAAGRGGASTSTSGHLRRESLARNIRRDELCVLPHRTVDQLHQCLAEHLRDRERLTLKEAHLLMNEAAALQVHADDQGYGDLNLEATRGYTTTFAYGGGAGTPRALSPEQRYARSHPLLDSTTPGSAAAIGGSRTPRGAATSALFAAQPPQHPEPKQQQAPSIVVDGRRYVLQEALSGPAEGGVPSAAAPSPPRTHHDHPHAYHRREAAADGGSGGPSSRLLAAAEEFAAAEQAHALEREDWAAERDELRQRVALLEGECHVLRERLLLKDREADSLVVRNTQMAQRLSTMDTASTLQAHFVLLSRIAVQHAGAVADAAFAKARLFGETSEAMAANSIALGRQLRRSKEELEQTKLHVRQQQKMIEASRKAVMQAWSDKAGIGQDGGNGSARPAPGGDATGAPPVWERPSAFSDTETTMF